MSKAIGIDFGFTNAVVAVKLGNDIRVLQNKEDEDSTPSVVAFYKGRILVGRLAVDAVVSEPKNAVISPNRLIGRSYSDPEIQTFKEHNLCEAIAPIDGTEDIVMVLLGGEMYSPVQISSMILKKLKEDAEFRLGEGVEYAVIAVPVYFTQKQRDAVQKAGQLAGFKVQRILDNPIAAAMAYEIGNAEPDEHKTVLVYDFGGSSFSVSILTAVGGVFGVLQTEGDIWLGGEVFDRKIMDYLIEHVKRDYGIDPLQNSRFMMALKKEAEKAKIELSNISRTQVIVPGLLPSRNGNLIDIDPELTRDQFETMIAGDVQRSIDLVNAVMKNADLRPDQIDQVLLVGGSSKIPMVRRALINIFGEEKSLMNVDPIKCVAVGAAILASSLESQVESPGISLGGVSPVNYGIQTVGNKFEVVIPKGSPIPTPEPVRKMFYIDYAGTPSIEIRVYAGFNPLASKNELQGIARLEIPAGFPKGTPVNVSFSLDKDGILTMQASLRDGSGREVEVYLDPEDQKRSEVEKEPQDWKRTTEELDRYGWGIAHEEKPAPYLDENVQFTVYRPKIVQPLKWYPLLAFAHLSDRPQDAIEDEPNPIEEVQEQAKRVLGGRIDEYQDIVQDSRQPVPHEGELTLVPEIPGVEFNPPRRTFHWRESVHREEFRLRASVELDGKTARGRLSIFLGNIILAEVNLSIRVDSRMGVKPSSSPFVSDSAQTYRRIFASYSHNDLSIVEEFEGYARALGDEYLRDLVHLRAGEVWDEQIRQLVDQAQIFQLFWSWNSIRSEFVEKEWRYALSLSRPFFIRPVYWEEPLPEIGERGLPPEELRRLHFQRIYPISLVLPPPPPPPPAPKINYVSGVSMEIDVKEKSFQKDTSGELKKLRDDVLKSKTGKDNMKPEVLEYPEREPSPSDKALTEKSATLRSEISSWNKVKLTYFLQRVLFTILFFVPMLAPIMFYQQSYRYKMLLSFIKPVEPVEMPLLKVLKLALLIALCMITIINYLTLLILFFRKKGLIDGFFKKAVFVRERITENHLLLFTLFVSILYGIGSFLISRRLDLLVEPKVLEIWVIPKFISIWIVYAFVRWVIPNFIKAWR